MPMYSADSVYNMYLHGKINGVQHTRRDGQWTRRRDPFYAIDPQKVGV
jgi:hypothetical protein